MMASRFLMGISPQHIAGALGEAHVALDKPAISAADLSGHLAGVEVHDLVEVEALVRLAPAGNGNVEHWNTSPIRRTLTRNTPYERLRQAFSSD
jgi:hypothetical protein